MSKLIIIQKNIFQIKIFTYLLSFFFCSAITQLFRLTKISGNDQQANEYDKEGKILGIIFIILGIVFLSFGITRYFHSQYLMTKGHFPASRGSIVIGSILTVLVLATFFIVIMTNDRS